MEPSSPFIGMRTYQLFLLKKKNVRRRLHREHDIERTNTCVVQPNNVAPATFYVAMLLLRVVIQGGASLLNELTIE